MTSRILQDDEPIVLKIEIIETLGDGREVPIRLWCWQAGELIILVACEDVPEFGLVKGEELKSAQYDLHREWSDEAYGLLVKEQAKRDAARLNIRAIGDIHEKQVIRFPQPGGNAA